MPQQPAQQPSPEVMAAQQAAASNVPATPETLGLTPAEQAFMDRAGMTLAQLKQYEEWKKIDQELGGKPALN